MKAASTASACAALVLSLAACGQKGPLLMPAPAASAAAASSGAGPAR